MYDRNLSSNSIRIANRLHSGGIMYNVYHGGSMWPTLREPELLEVIPYGDRQIRRGDVIFFGPPGGVSIVHRVVSIHPHGIRTRGDNLSESDRYLCQPADVKGRVVTAWRGARCRRVLGGWLGRLYVCLLRPWHHILRIVFAIMRPCYRGLLRSSIVARLLPSCFRPRVVVFGGNGRRALQLVYGRRTVGYFDAEQCRWKIKHPYQLFVNLATLLEISQSLSSKIADIGPEASSP